MTEMEKVNEAPYLHLIYPHRYPSMRSKKLRNYPLPGEKALPEILDEGYRVARPITKRLAYVDLRLSECFCHLELTSQHVLLPLACQIYPPTHTLGFH